VADQLASAEESGIGEWHTSTSLMGTRLTTVYLGLLAGWRKRGRNWLPSHFDLLEPRFWLTSELPTNRSLSVCLRTAEFSSG